MKKQDIQNKISTLKNQLIREENIASYHRSELEKSEENIESTESTITVLEGQLLHLEEFEEKQEEEAKQRLEDSKESYCGHDDVYGSGMDNLTINTKEE